MPVKLCRTVRTVHRIDGFYAPNERRTTLSILSLRVCIEVETVGRLLAFLANPPE
jgi:hypothetical protein